METHTSHVKSYTGRWLAHNQKPLRERAFVGADLVSGRGRLVEPTVLQAAHLVRVSSGYITWALRRESLRFLVCEGVVPLVPAPTPKAAKAFTVPPTDTELVELLKLAGPDRAFRALEQVL